MRVKLSVRAKTIRPASTETWELRGEMWHMVKGEQYWDGTYEPISAADFPSYAKCFDLTEGTP